MAMVSDDDWARHPGALETPFALQVI
jgi:hypothetical protein